MRIVFLLLAFASFVLANIPTQTNTKTYDALNRLKTGTDAKGTSTYSYDAIGRQIRVDYPNGVTTSYEKWEI
jgi:YD repeat-containing protein